ncbi:hypothetical protein PM082_016833 [Marasmius tenuissimus]|nr:hypothetical protein PM082_016833 [Marasmius tenuissimus]
MRLALGFIHSGPRSDSAAGSDSGSGLKFGIQATKAAHDASGSTVVFNFEGGEYQTLIQHSFRVVYNFCSKGT